MKDNRVLFLLVFLCVPMFASGQTNNIEALWKQADEYYEKGDVDKTIEIFTRIISINPGDSTAYNNRALMYQRKGEIDRAIEDLTQAIRLKPNDAKPYMTRATIYADQEKYDRAIQDLNRSLSLDPNNFAALVNRGEVYRRGGYWGKAISDFTAVLAKNPNNDIALRGLSNIYAEQGDYEGAIRGFTDLLKRYPDDPGANNDRAIVYSIMGDYERAIADFTQAIKINPIPIFYKNRGNEYLRKGDIDKGYEDWEQALKAAESSRNLNTLLDFGWMFSGLVKGKKKSDTAWEKAVRLSRLSVSMAVGQTEKIRSSLGSRGAEIMAKNLRLYYAGVDLEIKYGSVGKAFEYAEAMRSRGFLEQVGTTVALRLPGVTEAERRAIQKLTMEIEDLQDFLNEYRSIQIETKYAAVFADAALRLTQAEGELAGLDDAIGRRIPQYQNLRSPRPVAMENAKQWCGDRAVLEYVLRDDSIKNIAKEDLLALGSYCLVLTKNGVTAVPLDPAFDYLKAVNELRNQIINDASLARGLTVMAQADRGPFEQTRNALYAKLIKPVLPHIPANIKNIVIVPDGALMFLPFDVLRESADTPDLGETYSLSFSPSVSVSILAAKKAASRGSEPLLAFGGALYDRNGVAADRGRGYVSLIDGRGLIVEGPEAEVFNGGAGKYFSKRIRWNNLPGTETEVKALQKLAFPHTNPMIFTGRDASEAKVKELSANGSLKTYPFIHFACHGYFDEALPAMSSIIFSEVSGLVNTGEDGYLTIPEILLLTMDARMVVLSACETGLGQVKQGDGLVGLPRAFLVAGAESVGVSLWSISDEATVEFMTRLYRNVVERKMSFRESYYSVRNEFRKDSKWSHPYYWAAFTLYE